MLAEGRLANLLPNDGQKARQITRTTPTPDFLIARIHNTLKQLPLLRRGHAHLQGADWWGIPFITVIGLSVDVPNSPFWL